MAQASEPEMNYLPGYVFGLVCNLHPVHFDFLVMLSQEFIGFQLTGGEIMKAPTVRSSR